MPIYEYKRPDGSTIEVMQKMSDPPLVNDPETGVPLERVFHPIAVHFKGSGFYNTDYGTKKRARENEKSSDDTAKKSDGAAKDKSESKSDVSKAEPVKKDSTSSTGKPQPKPKPSSSSSSSSSSD